MAEMIGGVVLAILVGLGLFLILRYFWLWYWKIDKVVDLLERIDENTRKTVDEIVPKEEIDISSKKTTKTSQIKEGLDIYEGDDKVDCPACSHIYNPKELKCPNCGRANPSK